jgi:hypothetical protein
VVIADLAIVGDGEGVVVVTIGRSDPEDMDKLGWLRDRQRPQISHFMRLKIAGMTTLAKPFSDNLQNIVPSAQP